MANNGGNQFTKARSLGLPIPEVSKETREKLAKSSRKSSYFSKESQIVINEILQSIGHDDKTYYASLNREFCISEGNETFFYDLCLFDRKIIVEYNCSAFHVRDITLDFRVQFSSMGSKYDIFYKDERKRMAAEKRGFIVLYVWDTSKQDDIKRVIDYIGTPSGLRSLPNVL